MKIGGELSEKQLKYCTISTTCSLIQKNLLTEEAHEFSFDLRRFLKPSVFFGRYVLLNMWSKWYSTSKCSGSVQFVISQSILIRILSLYAC
jgi:hypothetical protein